MVVRAENDKDTSQIYWVGKVVDVYKDDSSDYVSRLKVHWHDDESRQRGDDIFTFKFVPCYKSRQRKRRKIGKTQRPTRQELQSPWCDTIHTDTVVVAFESLTKRRSLPLNVQKKLS